MTTQPGCEDFFIRGTGLPCRMDLSLCSNHSRSRNIWISAAMKHSNTRSQAFRENLVFCLEVKHFHGNTHNPFSFLYILIKKRVCFLAGIKENHPGEGKGAISGVFGRGLKAGVMVFLRQQWSSASDLELQGGLQTPGREGSPEIGLAGEARQHNLMSGF